MGTGTYGNGNYTKISLGDSAFINGGPSYLAIIRGKNNLDLCIIGRGSAEYYQTGISFIYENNEYKTNEVSNSFIDTITPRKKYNNFKLDFCGFSNEYKWNWLLL